MRKLLVLLFVAARAAAQLTAVPQHNVALRLGSETRAFTIDSKILGETRRIYVALPPSFDRSAPARRYPLTVVLDGQSGLAPVVAMSDALVREGQIPESVLVAVANTNRLRDLTPPGLSVSGSSLQEGGDRFLDFLEKELVPAIDRQFRTAPPRTIVGHSSGGILVTYAAATRDVFRIVLAIDTPMHLGDHWLAKKLLARTRTAGQALRYASYETRFGWSDEQWTGLTAAAPATWKLHRERLAHETHNSMPWLANYLGLRELFADYSMLAAPVFPTTSIVRHYDSLTASYGAPLVPPAPLLRQVVEDLLMEGRGALAATTFETLVAGYGQPPDAAKLREQIATVSRRPPPGETVEGLLATPFPSADEARRYLGEWEGESWVRPEVKHRVVLRLTEKDGRVTGTFTMFPEPEVELVQRLEYLKVTPEGLSFGYMNGMRPRGVLVYDGVLANGVLSGLMRFGGIVFTRAKESPIRRNTIFRCGNGRRPATTDRDGASAEDLRPHGRRRSS